MVTWSWSHPGVLLSEMDMDMDCGLLSVRCAAADWVQTVVKMLLVKM